jgi:hypothetical protein
MILTIFNRQKCPSKEKAPNNSTISTKKYTILEKNFIFLHILLCSIEEMSTFAEGSKTRRI